jgi:hypothetical protein
MVSKELFILPHDSDALSDATLGQLAEGFPRASAASSARIGSAVGLVHPVLVVGLLWNHH